MSSSDPRPVHASPWSLDEFASADIFPSFDMPTHAHGARGLEGAASEQLRAEIEDAYERGVADGEKKARAAADARVARTVDALRECAESVQLHEARWLSNLEENIAALAVSVARQLVQREVSSDASVVEALVRQALAQYPLDETITIRLSTQDYALCTAARASSGAMDGHDVRWIADPNIQPGGCLVEGRERIIDGRVDTALERFYRSIGQVQI